METKQFKKYVNELSELIMKNIKEELADKKKYKAAAEDAAIKLHKSLVAKKEAFKSIEKKCRVELGVLNILKSQSVDDVGVEFERFHSKIEDQRQVYEKYQRSQNHLSAEIQNWNFVYYQMKSGSDKMKSIVYGGLLAKYLTLLLISSIMGPSDPQTDDEKEMSRLAALITRSDVLDIPEGTEITSEFIAEKLGDEMVNAMQFERNRSMNDIDSMKKHILHYADEFNLKYIKDKNELKESLGEEQFNLLSEAEVENIICLDLFRAVEEFARTMRDNKGKNDIRNMEEGEISNLVILTNTAKTLFTSGVKELLDFDLSYLKAPTIAQMWVSYNKRFKVYAKSVIESTTNENLKAYGVEKLALLLTFTYYSVFIVEQVPLIFSIGY